MPITVNQRAGVEGEFAFESVDGTASLPVTAHWRVTCGSRVLSDWQSAPLVVETSGGVVTRVSVAVEVPGTVNVLSDTSAQRETHVLTVCADMDTDREYSEDFEFYVKRGGR